MNTSNDQIDIRRLLSRTPNAVAMLNGAGAYRDVRGTLRLYNTSAGVLAAATFTGLPRATGYCDSPIFALHIHEGTSCSGDMNDAFADAGMHYNPYGCPHPYHAGDMPPIFSANGIGLCVFLTDRFTVDEVIGRTVILHGRADDFMTQPSGNAGAKIACGVIMPISRSVFKKNSF